ncbi:MAG: hypothetical protein QM817_40720 [Archangium sp.]
MRFCSSSSRWHRSSSRRFAPEFVDARDRVSKHRLGQHVSRARLPVRGARGARSLLGDCGDTAACRGPRAHAAVLCRPPTCDGRQAATASAAPGTVSRAPARLARPIRPGGAHVGLGTLPLRIAPFPRRCARWRLNESSLADLLPLWSILREEDVTALVTPALDYVGCFELAALDPRFAGEDAIESTGEALRSFVGGLEDECTLHFLHRVSLDARTELDAYRATHGAGGPLSEYVNSRAMWLEGQTLRTARLFLFFSRGGSDSPLARGALGAPMPFAKVDARAKKQHTKRIRELGSLRNALRVRLGQTGLVARELQVDEVRRLHFELLNPSHATTPKASLAEPHDTLWSEPTIAHYGEALREYTEAELLLVEELEEERGHLRQERTFRRALTLKVLPEAGTGYFSAEPLLELAELDSEGRRRPIPFWLATSVRIQPQGRARFLLNAQHGLVEALRNAVPFLADRSIAKQAADAAKTGGIAGLFAELNAMSSKLVTLSVTLLLDGSSLEALNARTEIARAAFSAAGNSELLLEEISQLPAFLAILPGAGSYQFRKKTCTSRNAGDFLPVFAPWRGCARPVSLLTSPLGDSFRFDPFDRRLSPAHHGLIIADTGSGKSVSLGALTLDALAAGIDAILVDNGGSWEPMTRLLGGIHLPVDIKTPLTPFRPWKEMVGASGQLDPDNIQDVVTFLELCVREEGSRGFDKLTVQLVARAVKLAYESTYRARPDERPLMRAFREGLLTQATRSQHTDDKRICEDLARRLSLFTGDELFGAFLDRPSDLRFDANLITFDMAGVSKSPIMRSIAMATVMTTITTRAAARTRRTLVEVDEGHAYLGHDETAERFLERCYRVMRKFDVAMWMISQQFGDFVKAKSGDAILGNSPIKIFLRHRSGHDAVSDYFHFTPRMKAAFRALDMQSGHFSDLLLMYGERHAALRLALHPLAYWILTTDGEDKKLIARATAKNPHLTPVAVLRELAKRFPHGAPKGVAANAA